VSKLSLHSVAQILSSNQSAVFKMAGEQIVEQVPQTAEVMPVDPTNNVQAEQPVSAFFNPLRLGIPPRIEPASKTIWLTNSR
jgi:hypothetical protein